MESPFHDLSKATLHSFSNNFIIFSTFAFHSQMSRGSFLAAPQRERPLTPAGLTVAEVIFSSCSTSWT